MDGKEEREGGKVRRTKEEGKEGESESNIHKHKGRGKRVEKSREQEVSVKSRRDRREEVSKERINEGG